MYRMHNKAKQSPILYLDRLCLYLVVSIGSILEIPRGQFESQDNRFNGKRLFSLLFYYISSHIFNYNEPLLYLCITLLNEFAEKYNLSLCCFTFYDTMYLIRNAH